MLRFSVVFLSVMVGFLLVPLIGCSIVIAQTIPSRRYTAADGLPHSTVFRIMQDRKGYMWFGTKYGVSRFDGENFSNFNIPGGPAVNEVLSINELPDSTILISGYRSGLYLLSGDTIRSLKLASRLPPKRIVRIVPDALNRWWLSYLYTRRRPLGIIEDNCYRRLYFEDFSADFATPGDIYDVHPLSDSSVLIATSKGVFNISVQGELTKPYPSIDENVYVCTADRQGRVWMGADNRIYRADSAGSLTSFDTGRNNSTNQLLADRKNRVWCYNSELGFLRIEHDTLHRLAAQVSFGTAIVNAIFEDREGNIWVATYSRGLFCFTNTEMLNYTTSEGLPSDYATSFAEQGERILVGTMGGVAEIRKGVLQRKPAYTLRGDLIPNDIIVKNRDTVLIGTPDGLLAYADSTRIAGDTTIGILSFVRRPGKELWFGNYRGLYRSRSLFAERLLTFTELDARRIYGSVEDRDSALWFATDVGVFRMKGDSVRHHGVKGGEVRAVCLDSLGRKWFATGNGALVLDGSDWQSFTTREGLAHQRCTDVLTDAFGKVWIATLGGLCRYDGAKFITFDTRDGLVSAEVNRLFLDSDNFLWVGSTQGVSRFSVSKNREAQRAPPIYISSMRVDDREYDLESEISLPHDSRNIEIRYRGLKFRNPSDITYQYKWLRRDKKWQPWPNSPIRFPTLEPGAYTFMVRAGAVPGEWSELPARLSFRIEPPVWQTWWFKSLGFSLILLVLYVGLRLRLRLIHRRQAAQIELYSRMLNLRQQAVNSLVNPHFVANSLNSIQYFINRAQRRQANEYLSDFASLIRRTMEDAQFVLLPLQDELERLRLYLELEALRFAGKFSYSISVDPGIDVQTVKIPVMIIQPYVENAIWHGIIPSARAGEVRLVIRSGAAGRMHVVVDDNGIGLRASQARRRNGGHQSQGMRILKERLELISSISGKLLSVDVREKHAADGTTSGTQVCIDVPVDLENIGAF